MVGFFSMSYQHHDWPCTILVEGMANCLGHSSTIFFVSVANMLDESPITVYQENMMKAEEEEPDMFNPTEILDRTFQITYKKQDGTTKTMTGTLVAPNYEGSLEALFAYCVGLLEKTQIPVWTAQGWRSFLIQNVLSVEIL